MPAYIIARVDVTNPDQYKNYQALTPDAVAAFGGKFLVRGGDKETLEGPEETRRVVMLEFKDYATAKAFYDSDLYQAAKAERIGAADAQFILLDGMK